MFIGFSFTCDNFLTKALLVWSVVPKKKKSRKLYVSCKTRNTYDCAWVINRVSLWRAPYFTFIYEFNSKGESQEKHKLDIFNTHTKNWCSRRVLACTWIGRSQAFIAQTGLVSSRRKYKNMLSHLLGMQRIFFRSIFFATLVMTCTKYSDNVS